MKDTAHAMDPYNRPAVTRGNKWMAVGISAISALVIITGISLWQWIPNQLLMGIGLGLLALGIIGQGISYFTPTKLRLQPKQESMLPRDELTPSRALTHIDDNTDMASYTRAPWYQYVSMVAFTATGKLAVTIAVAPLM